MVHDGVQKGVLWREEALHHRHLGLCGRNAARSYWISILSTENLEERVSFTVRLAVPQCSDAGSYSSCQSPLPFPPKTISCSFPWSVNLVSVRKEPLSAFSPSPSAARARCHLAPAWLPPSIQMRAPSSFFMHLSVISLLPPPSLSLPLYRSLRPPLHCFYF